MPVIRDIPSRLERLNKECERLEAYRQLELEKFLKDPAVQGDTCYLLCTTFQSALDIGLGLLGTLGFTKPDNEVDVFALLAEKEIISQVCVSQLTAMHGLCSSLSQQYGEIDPQWVFQALQVNLTGLYQFAQQVQAFLDQ